MNLSVLTSATNVLRLPHLSASLSSSSVEIYMSQIRKHDLISILLYWYMHASNRAYKPLKRSIGAAP